MKKRREPIVCVTAYDNFSARVAEEAGVDLILVGDSLGNVIMGEPTTLGVTLEMVAHHTRAAASAVQRAMLVADMPFGSYGAGLDQALSSAVQLMRAGAHGVKLEGPYLEEVRALSRAGIPVMGHLGMTPQSVHAFGGFRVQGKGEDATEIASAACALQEAGAFAIVLELVPQGLAADITKRLEIPTIGIGAGPECDGQVQVFHDVLGLSPRPMKHSKRYAEGQSLLASALRSYADEVRSGHFPGPEHSF